MSGAKFTPGPWRRGSDDLNSRELWSDVIAPNGFIVARATVDRAERSSELAEILAYARANADLMAAAPELLEAAKAGKAYRDALQSCADDPTRMTSFCTAAGDDLDALFERWEDLSNAALAKAGSAA